MTILDKQRKRLREMVENSGAEVETALKEYSIALYQKMDDRKNPCGNFLTTLELLTYYTDYILLSNLNLKESMLTEEGFKRIQILSTINDFDDLLVEISANPPLLLEMMSSTLQVEELSLLGRMNLYHKLEEETIQYLSEINFVFIEEKDAYTRFIEPKDYIKHYEEQIQKYEQVMEEVTPQSIKDAIVTEIVGFLKNLSLYDYENYINNIKDMALFHYEYLKYVHTFQIELALYDKTEIEEVITYFEAEDIPTLAADLFSPYNYGYLKEFVWFYLENYTKGFLEDRKAGKITYEEVCAYTEKDTKTKGKIKDKKTRI